MGGVPSFRSPWSLCVKAVQVLLVHCLHAGGTPVNSHFFFPFQMISSLKGRVSELQLSAMDQKVQVKRLESEKQELKEQLELQQR